MRLLDTNPDKAYYGYFHVQKANDELAIDSLLISDELFRSSDVVTRKKYVSLVESVRDRGGTVYVFSTMHVSGQQLQQVSGVAAILRYPLPDLEELEDIAAAHEAGLIDEDDDDEEELTDEMRKEREDARVREDMADMGL
jgi:protein pelota